MMISLATTFMRPGRAAWLALALGLGGIHTGSASAQQAPKELKIAAVLASTPDEPWASSFLKAWGEVRAEKPHGLEINAPVYTDNAWGDPAEAALRLYARKGYDIVFALSSYSDQVKKIRNLYPKTLFVLTGNPNEALGGNSFLLYNRIYEPSYLLGVVAGSMTKTGVVGAVGYFPTEDQNDAMNAFFAGARSVRPDVKQKVAYIGSWWDPPLALESSKAQIAAGADQIYMMAGSFEACKQTVVCYGSYRDYTSTAPKNIASNSLGSWKPGLHWIIDQWYQARSADKPYNGNMDKRNFGMAEGGADITPLNTAVVSPAVAARVEAVRAKILAKEFVVPLVTTKPQSD
ncbi:BMP family ABC transporter substrate-binding protein [Pandoraea terrae]|nr:BMP family ABC transporter substrate-binding protein [Pandoraea terrae]